MLIGLGVIGNPLFSQNFPYANIPISQQGKTLESPFAGGLNQPQFSQIHLNSDNLIDLMVFERKTGEILCFHATQDAANKVRYTYAPEDAAQFPPNLEDWVLLADYNCDGLPDLFTASFGFGGISVFENIGSRGLPDFRLAAATLTDVADGSPLYADARDLPAFTDVDEDGDLDILAFEAGGFSVNWFQNRAVEDSGGCGPLAFTLADGCWGNFQEDGLTNAISLQVACKRGGPKHAGSTLCVLDEDGDQKKDVLIGDLNFNNLVFLHNGGSLTSADMDRSVFNYPGGSPASIHIFPSAFWMDVDLDGKKDLLATTNAPNVGANYDHVWLYRNTGTGAAVNWDFSGKDFLLNEMIETGSYSKPAFFDENGDGLLDMLIGNYLYRDNRNTTQAAFTLYTNTGTAANPEFELSDRNYLDISTLIGPTESDVAPVFVDIDDDGDDDLVVGTFSGKLLFFRNTPFPDNSVNLSFDPTFLQNIDIGQHAMPSFADIDGDGDEDMIVGENGGTLNLFINSGSAQSPIFPENPDDNFWGEINVTFGALSGYSAPRLLRNTQGGWDLIVGTEAGYLMRYEVQGSGKFPVLDSVWGNVRMGARITPAFADLDNNGNAELIVGGIRGGIAMYESPLPVSNEPLLANTYPVWKLAGNRLVAPSKGWIHADITVMDIQGRTIANWNIWENQESDIPDLHLSGIVYLRLVPKFGKPQILKYLSE